MFNIHVYVAIDRSSYQCENNTLQNNWNFITNWYKRSKPTLPWAIVFVLLKTSKFSFERFWWFVYFFRRCCSGDHLKFFFFFVNRSRLMNHFVLSDRNLIFINITLLYISLTLYTSLNRLMLMGPHSSVRSASNLQSRGSGFDPWSVGACCKHEIVILHG